MLLLQVAVFSVACQQWTSQPNTNYAHGRGDPATNLQECQAACVANTECNGLDWVTAAPSGSQCWLSGSWSGDQDSTMGVTHYVLIRNCAGRFSTSCELRHLHNRISRPTALFLINHLLSIATTKQLDT